MEYAVKIMERKNVCMDEHKFNEEIKVLSKLRHPNIIRLHDVYKTKQQILVVTGMYECYYVTDMNTTNVSYEYY